LIVTIIISIAAWAIVALLCICVGSSGRWGWPADPYARHFRIEVVLLASLVGAALGGSGVVYQAILRNPLADPYLLGVSSGAALFAFVWRFPFAGALGGAVVLALSQQAFSFVGAMGSVGIALLLASRAGRLEPLTLLLVGVIINAINGALFLLLNARFPEITAGTGNALSFLVGGIQTNLMPQQEAVALIIFAIGFVALLYLCGQLNAATLGEAEAQALGVRIHRVRWMGLIIASIVTAAAVSISGPIGFVGLICPHLVRLLVGQDQRKLLPAATAAGAALLAIADAAARMLSGAKFVNTLLPVGVLTALLGGPFFLLLLWRSRRSIF
jgi:iron complex transport system permease protein